MATFDWYWGSDDGWKAYEPIVQDWLNMAAAEIERIQKKGGSNDGKSLSFQDNIVTTDGQYFDGRRVYINKVHCVDVLSMNQYQIQDITRYRPVKKIPRDGIYVRQELGIPPTSAPKSLSQDIHFGGDIRNFGRNLDVNMRSPDQAAHKRRKVILETLELLKTQHERDEYHQLAQANLKRWEKSLAEGKAVTTVQKFIVVSGDWGEVTQKITKLFGTCFAVLNMANAYVFGGGYVEGMPAQEENMFRRTDCHFSMTSDEYDQVRDRYSQAKTDLINAKYGEVFMDVRYPRVCLRGPESNDGDGGGYELLKRHEIFPFYELRAAAVDYRAPNRNPFNPDELRKRINAQITTLKRHRVRHAVLSAFGCGCFQNPTEIVAETYRAELNRCANDFDCVVFAVYDPGYGPDNFGAFQKVFASSDGERFVWECLIDDHWQAYDDLVSTWLDAGWKKLEEQTRAGLEFGNGAIDREQYFNGCVRISEIYYVDFFQMKQIRYDDERRWREVRLRRGEELQRSDADLIPQPGQLHGPGEVRNIGGYPV